MSIDEMQPTSSAVAIAFELRRRLASIERQLIRLVELAQSPAKNFLAAGSVPYGGTVGVTAVQLIAANPNRRGLSVQNIGAAGNLTVGLGSTAPQANTGITLAPGQSWDGRVSGQVWQGSISIVGSAAGVVYTALDVSGPSRSSSVGAA